MGSLHAVLIALRILLVVFVGIAVAVAAAPLLVIADLAGGGQGWGLCVDGLSSCASSYFVGPELLVVLFLILFVVLAAVAICARLIRRLDPGQ